MHRLLRRRLSTPSFTEAAARLVRGATKAQRDARGATKQSRDAAPRRPEATHKRAASIVQRKAEARVEHALAAAVAERRHDTTGAFMGGLGSSRRRRVRPFCGFGGASREACGGLTEGWG